MELLVGFLLGLIGGYILHSIVCNLQEVGIFHIDFTDTRKDLVKLELTKDLDEFFADNRVIFRVESRCEDDFKKKINWAWIRKFLFGLVIGFLIIGWIAFIFGPDVEEEPVSYKKASFVYEKPPIPMPEMIVEETSEDDPIYDIEATYPPFDSNSLDWDWDYVVRVVAQEAGLTAGWLSPKENDIRVQAQMAVAQCIKNTAEATGMNPEQVVKAPNQYAKPYTGNEDELEMVNESCLRVFVYGETVTDRPIQYFYSTAGGFYSKWHENCLTCVETIGPTKFFVA